MKYRSLKLWESERPSRPLYQLTVDGMKKDIIGVHPFFWKSTIDSPIGNWWNIPERKF